MFIPQKYIQYSFANILGLVSYINLQFNIFVCKYKRSKVIALVMSNMGQQQYFEDLCALAMKERKNYYFFFVNDYQVSRNEKINFFKDKIFINCFLYRWIWGVDLALHSEISCRSRGVTDICYIGHGFPGKHTVWSDGNLRSFNHYFLYGPKDRAILSFLTNNRPEKLKHITFWDVGYPKYDAQINNEIQTNDVRSNLNLINQKFIILFAPAWDPGGCLRTYGYRLFDKLGSLAQYDFIVKFHPASLVTKASEHYSFYTGGTDWASVMEEISKKYSNIYYYQEHSINPLFKIANMLITDFSGVALGFFIENKPVVCIDCPEYFDTILPSWGQDGDLSRSNHLFNNGRDASFIVDNLDCLDIVIEEARKDSKEMSLKRKNIAKELLYNPGRGTEVMLNSIDRILYKKTV